MAIECFVNDCGAGGPSLEQISCEEIRARTAKRSGRVLSLFERTLSAIDLLRQFGIERKGLGYFDDVNGSHLGHFGFYEATNNLERVGVGPTATHRHEYSSVLRDVLTHVVDVSTPVGIQ
jgi:hypothetical protein